MLAGGGKLVRLHLCRNLVGLMMTLAKQLGKDHITCNAIARGNVTSDAGMIWKRGLGGFRRPGR